MAPDEEDEEGAVDGDEREGGVGGGPEPSQEPSLADGGNADSNEVAEVGARTVTREEMSRNQLVALLVDNEARLRENEVRLREQDGELRALRQAVRAPPPREPQHRQEPQLRQQQQQRQQQAPPPRNQAAAAAEPNRDEDTTTSSGAAAQTWAQPTSYATQPRQPVQQQAPPDVQNGSDSLSSVTTFHGDDLEAAFASARRQAARVRGFRP